MKTGIPKCRSENLIMLVILRVQSLILVGSGFPRVSLGTGTVGYWKPTTPMNKSQLFCFPAYPKRITEGQHAFLSLASHKTQPICGGWSHLSCANCTKGNLPLSASMESPSQPLLCPGLYRSLNCLCSLLFMFLTKKFWVRKKLKMKLKPLST